VEAHGRQRDDVSGHRRGRPAPARRRLALRPRSSVREPGAGRSGRDWTSGAINRQLTRTCALHPSPEEGARALTSVRLRQLQAGSPATRQRSLRTFPAGRASRWPPHRESARPARVELSCRRPGTCPRHPPCCAGGR
jgi:hypothetical protein